MNKEEAIEHLRRKNEGKILEFDEEITEMIREIERIKREPRSSAILIEGNISYACDKLLAYRFEADVFDDLSLHDKRKLLVKLGIMGKSLSDDIEKIKTIRNIYAHRRKIQDKTTLKEIENIIKSTNTFKSLSPSSRKTGEPFELFLFISSRILAALSNRYRIMMIDEINKYAEFLKEK